MGNFYLSFSRLALAAGLLLGGAGAAGAQVAGYVFSQSQGTYTTITGGTLLNNSGADDAQFNNTGTTGTTSMAAGPGYPVGFTFTLGGVAYDRFAINNNGWIALGNSSGGSAAVSAMMPTGNGLNYAPLNANTTQSYPVVAAFGTDLVAPSFNSLRFETVGTAPNRTLVVQWEVYTIFQGGIGITINFQIRLEEGSNLVQLVYGPVSAPNSSVMVQAGLHGTAGADVVGRANTVTSAATWTTTMPLAGSMASIPLSSVAKPPLGLRFTFAPAACAVPTAVAVSAVTLNSASVSFGAATGISSYTVTLTPQGGTPTVVTSTATSSPVALSGLTPGTTYTVQVASNCSNGTLAAGAPAAFTTPVANDECATALPLAVNATCSNTAVSTNGATSSPATLPTGGCSTTNTPDVWYRVTVPASGGLTVTSSALTGSSTAVVAMEAYFGSCTGLIPLACTYGNGTFGTLSVRNQTPGDQLYLRVRANDSATGAGSVGSFNLCAVATPANDNPTGAQALPLSTACTPVTTSNVAATTTTPNGYTNPGTCGQAINPVDVWYSFRTNPSGTGPQTVRVIVNGTAAGLVRMFSAASSAGPFTQVDCSAGLTNNTNAAPLRVTTLAPNTQYFLSVAGYGSNDATGAFTICVQDQTVTAARAALGGQAVEVYPNPAVAGRATLRLPAHGAAQVTLLNALGQAVRTQAVAGASASEVELNVAGLAAGLYSVQVRAGAETAVLRLAVE